MPTSTNTDQGEVREATPDEGRELFDTRVRELLGISGEEFLRRWDSGYYMDATDANINAVTILIPFAR